jgi:hypothetical protein
MRSGGDDCQDRLPATFVFSQMLTLPGTRASKKCSPGAPNVDRLERPKGEKPIPMTQINARVESEGLQLESLLGKRNLEKKCAVVFGTPAVRSAAVAKESGRRTGPWSVGLSLNLGLSPGKSPRAAARTECWIDALKDNSVTNISAVSGKQAGPARLLSEPSAFANIHPTPTAEAFRKRWTPWRAGEYRERSGDGSKSRCPTPEKFSAAASI